MARIAILGSLVADRVVRLGMPLQVGGHQQGTARAERCGGGAANAAVALARAGHHVSLVSAVGDDPSGHALVAILKRSGVDTAEVAVVDAATSNSLLLVDPAGERTIVNLQRLHAPTPERLLELEADCIYVRSRAEGLAPLLHRLSAITQVVAHIPPCGNGAVPAGLLIGSAADLDPAFLADPWNAGQEVSNGEATWTVITHGAAGATAYGRKTRLEQPADKVTPVDTTGAGDCFAAGLVHGLTGGLPMARCLAVATAWGAAAVTNDDSLPGNGFPPEPA
jgi:sugar/nucleoside kinase (ribokinase family)